MKKLILAFAAAASLLTSALVYATPNVKVLFIVTPAGKAYMDANGLTPSGAADAIINSMTTALSDSGGGSSMAFSSAGVVEGVCCGQTKTYPGADLAEAQGSWTVAFTRDSYGADSVIVLTDNPPDEQAGVTCSRDGCVNRTQFSYQPSDAISAVTMSAEVDGMDWMGIAVHELAHQVNAKHEKCVGCNGNMYSYSIKISGNETTCHVYYDIMAQDPDVSMPKTQYWIQEGNLYAYGEGNTQEDANDAMSANCASVSGPIYSYTCEPTPGSCHPNGTSGSFTCNHMRDEYYHNPVNGDHSELHHTHDSNGNPEVVYFNCPNTTRLYRFSNPSSTFLGLPTGDTQHNAMAEMISKAASVADYHNRSWLQKFKALHNVVTIPR